MHLQKMDLQRIIDYIYRKFISYRPAASGFLNLGLIRREYVVSILIGWKREE